MKTTIDRRSFLGRGAAFAGAGLFSSAAVETLQARSAQARPKKGHGYGALRPAADETTGTEILALPAGFTYVTFGHMLSPMSDGNRTPLALDGMAAFPFKNGQVRLIRNHEDRNRPGQGSNLPTAAEAGAVYDASAGGGTTTLDYDPASRTLVQDFVSLKGTIVNCAGGYGFGCRSWLTGEETVAGPSHSSSSLRFPKRHGYAFEVPVDRGPQDANGADPIVPMGRFAHEAVATDQRTGIVYQTEDAGTGRGSGFYRYLPEDPRDLHAGGRLQMLAIQGKPKYDAREGQKLNRSLPVVWVDIEDVDPEYKTSDDPGSVFNQGHGHGAAKFNRLEGCWWDGDRSVYFVSTSGGDVKNGDVNGDGFREGFGQVWEYRTSGRSGGQLRLIYESTGSEALDSPDNLCVTPRGGLILCEDDASSDSDISRHAPGIEDVNRLIGYSRDGGVFELAVNRLNDSELAGATFSPDGEILFVNIFGESQNTPSPNEGMTIAITGPWERGPL